MSRASRRGVSAEERAARALGTQRIHRARGESAPDVAPVRTAGGAWIGAEVKHRARLPRLAVDALAQAHRYFEGKAIPIAVLFERGKRGGIVCLDLDAFARLVGLDVAALPMAERVAPRALKQLPLLDMEGRHG